MNTNIPPAACIKQGWAGYYGAVAVCLSGFWRGSMCTQLAADRQGTDATYTTYTVHSLDSGSQARKALQRAWARAQAGTIPEEASHGIHRVRATAVATAAPERAGANFEEKQAPCLFNFVECEGRCAGPKRARRAAGVEHKTAGRERSRACSTSVSLWYTN
ncbi:hypothetical protein V8D89_007177 [Ganoderma adspersum]